MGYDLILNGETLDEEYMDLLKTIYLEKCKDMGVNLDYLFESY
jgi:hypothetical protein